MLNRFEYEIRRELDKLQKIGVYYFRLYDTKTFRQVSEKIIAIKQPCDFIAIYNGKTYLLELKSSKLSPSYKLKYIKEHQIKSLIEANRSGNGNVVGTFLISNRSNVRNLKCYVVSPERINNLVKSGAKSIKWEHLKKISLMEIPRRKGGWDLIKLFNI